MSEPEAAQEPTMEEILASIRRIISEDDGANDAAEASAETVEADEEYSEDYAEEEADEPFAAEPEEVHAEMTAEEFETSNPNEDRYASVSDVFGARQQQPFESFEGGGEAAEEPDYGIEDEAEQSNVAAFQPQQQFVQEAEPVAEAGYESYDEEVQPEESYGFVSAEQEQAPEFDETPEPEFEAETVSTTHEFEYETAARNGVEEEMLSPNTESHVANLIGQLNESQPASESSTGGSTSLEGMVRELLRPMLQSWLDENLPPIVERIVEREIKRVTRAR